MLGDVDWRSGCLAIGMLRDLGIGDWRSAMVSIGIYDEHSLWRE